jgi:hypothetical protein
MMNKDVSLIWEAYLQVDESLSAAEALSRMRGAIAAGHEDLIPDILDTVDNKDKPALVKRAKMLDIHHPAFNAFVPPAGEEEEYPSSVRYDRLVTDNSEFWTYLYKEMWWSHIARATEDDEEGITQSHKVEITKATPVYVVSGPKIQVEFYVIEASNLGGAYNVLVMKENRAGTGYPDGYYIINDYDLETVKEWWEENWSMAMNYQKEWEDDAEVRHDAEDSLDIEVQELYQKLEFEPNLGGKLDASYRELLNWIFDGNWKDEAKGNLGDAYWTHNTQNARITISIKTPQNVRVQWIASDDFNFSLPTDIANLVDLLRRIDGDDSVQAPA